MFGESQAIHCKSKMINVPFVKVCFLGGDMSFGFTLVSFLNPRILFTCNDICSSLLEPDPSVIVLWSSELCHL